MLIDGVEPDSATTAVTAADFAQESVPLNIRSSPLASRKATLTAIGTEAQESYI